MRRAGFKILRPIPETHMWACGKAYACVADRPAPFSHSSIHIIELSLFTKITVYNGTGYVR